VTFGVIERPEQIQHFDFSDNYMSSGFFLLFLCIFSDASIFKMEGVESSTINNEQSTDIIDNNGNTPVSAKVNNDTPIEYKIAALIFKYYAPIQIIIALFGNTMIFLVFSRKTMRGSVTSFLFRVLAVADTYMILVACIPEVMLELGGTRPAYATDPQCKLHRYQ